MSAPKQIHIGMRGNIIAHVQKEASVNTEHVYELKGQCAWSNPVMNDMKVWHYAVGCTKSSGTSSGPFCPYCGDLIRVEA